MVSAKQVEMKDGNKYLNVIKEGMIHEAEGSVP